jgi:Domain of unknown function (DUF6458)
MEPLRIRGGAYRNLFPGHSGDPQPIPRLGRYEKDNLARLRRINEGRHNMGLGVGIFLSAVGAILAFAVSKTVSGVNIHTIGWILLIVGIIGIVLSMIFWSSWAGPGYWSRRRGGYVEEAPPPGY